MEVTLAMTHLSFLRIFNTQKYSDAEGAEPKLRLRLFWK